MKKIDREIYEHGELEREAARTADIATHGGLFYRFFKWLERLIGKEREVLIAARDEERAEERAAPGGVLTESYVENLVNEAGKSAVHAELRRLGWSASNAPLWIRSAIAREMIAVGSPAERGEERGDG